MALWNGLEQAATLAQLAGVDAGGLISMIIDAVQTVKRNKEECRQLEQDVMVINCHLQLLQQLGMMRFPVIRVLLHGLEDTLRKVYMLVMSCQQSNIMYSFFMAGNQSQKFRDVRERINFYLRLYPMFSHTHMTYLLCGLFSHVNPSGIQPQALEEVLESFASQPNPDSRCGINSEITLSTTGSEVPCAPLSGITEFTLSTLVATTQHFPKESITDGGGHYQVTMQKIVIKTIQMNCIRRQEKAMVLAAKLNGVSSMEIKGDGKDMLEVVGCGVDAVCLLKCLRKKIGHAEILRVQEFRRSMTEAQPVVVNTEEARPADNPASRQRRARSRGGFRAILTKLSKSMWRRARRNVSPPPPPPSPPRVEHTDNPAPAASGGPSYHLISAPSTSTAVSAASPPAFTQEQLERNPWASATQRRLDYLPPVSVATARRGRRTFNVSSRLRVSARPAAARRHQRAQQQALGNVSSSSNAGGADRDELAAVEAGCVLDEYVAMFDGPMPPAVIAALAGAVFHFHVDDKDSIHMGNA